MSYNKSNIWNSEKIYQICRSLFVEHQSTTELAKKIDLDLSEEEMDNKEDWSEEVEKARSNMANKVSKLQEIGIVSKGDKEGRKQLYNLDLDALMSFWYKDLKEAIKNKRKIAEDKVSDELKFKTQKMTYENLMSFDQPYGIDDLNEDDKVYMWLLGCESALVDVKTPELFSRYVRYYFSEKRDSTLHQMLFEDFANGLLYCNTSEYYYYALIEGLASKNESIARLGKIIGSSINEEREIEYFEIKKRIGSLAKESEDFVD